MNMVSSMKEGINSPWDRQIMKKVAIIENIHEDGLDLLKNTSGYEYEIIDDTSEKNLS